MLWWYKKLESQTLLSWSYIKIGREFNFFRYLKKKKSVLVFTVQIKIMHLANMKHYLFLYWVHSNRRAYYMFHDMSYPFYFHTHKVIKFIFSSSSISLILYCPYYIYDRNKILCCCINGICSHTYVGSLS